MGFHFLASMTAFAICLAASAHVNAAGSLPNEISEAFASADRFILFSLNPDMYWVRPKSTENTKSKTDLFHEWRVLGKTTSLNQKERARLKNALSQGVSENQGEVASCFNPRHGIHMQVAKDTIDLVICFQCDQVEVFKNGVKIKALLTTSSPSTAFNKMLISKNIPLAARMK